MKIKAMGSIIFAGLLFAAGSSHAATRATASPSTRNYDCSKAGNANKAACRGAAKSTTPAAPAARATPAARNYDCSKAGNANKVACRGQASAASPTPLRKSRRYSFKPNLSACNVSKVDALLTQLLVDL